MLRIVTTAGQCTFCGADSCTDVQLSYRKGVTARAPIPSRQTVKAVPATQLRAPTPSHVAELTHVNRQCLFETAEAHGGTCSRKPTGQAFSKNGQQRRRDPECLEFQDQSYGSRGLLPVSFVFTSMPFKKGPDVAFILGSYPRTLGRVPIPPVS